MISANDGSQPWLKSESGLQYRNLRSSDGTTVGAGDEVIVHYRLALATPVGGVGEWIEDTWDDEQPIRFVVGEGQVLLGVDEGVVGMAVAGYRHIHIPPHLAHGERGWGQTVPESQYLLVELYVVEVTEQPDNSAEQSDHGH